MLTPYFADLGNVNGTWTLRFRDLCGNDSGSVSAATLYLTTDGVAADADKDGVPDAADDCPAKAGTSERLPGHHSSRHRLPDLPRQRDREVAEGAVRVHLRRDGA